MFLVSGLLVSSNLSSSNHSFSSENLASESNNNLEVLGTNNVSILSTNDEEVSPLTVTLQSYNKTTVSHSFQFRVGINNSYPEYATEANYYIGYYEEEITHPASLSYDVYDSNNKFVSTMSTEIVQKSNHGIGTYLGATTFTSYCDVELANDLTIDLDSIKLINCYKAQIVLDESGSLTSRTPDLKNPASFKISKANSYVERDLANFLDFTFDSYANYADYLAIKMNVKNYGKNVYSSLSTVTQSLYTKNKDKIDSGAYSLRTRLSFGGDSFIRVTSSDKKVVNITPKDAELTSGDLKYLNDEESSILFLNLSNEKFKEAGISSRNDIYNVELCAVSVSVEILNNDTSKVLARSSVSQRFGVVSLKMQEVKNNDGSTAIDKVSTDSNKNYTALFITGALILLVIYVALAVCYYFYLKKKDKDSEFKVLNNKQFIKINILGVICLESILLDILYIFARSNLFNNSLKIYNPLDWVICILSVIVICLGGYFIKYYWNSFKSYREKKARERLHLNANSEDDGTN